MEEMLAEIEAQVASANTAEVKQNVDMVAAQYAAVSLALNMIAYSEDEE